MQRFADIATRLSTNVSSVILGKPEVVKLALAGLFAEGHLLFEDVPGVGKTTLARAIAASVRGEWRRIQFTPDLLPSDVTGVTIFNQGTRQFEFHGGPIFANIVVADEINRASPKTQSSLLEVMEERYVTVDGQRHGVPALPRGPGPEVPRRGPVPRPRALPAAGRWSAARRAARR